MGLQERNRNQSGWTTRTYSQNEPVCPYCNGVGFVDYPVDDYMIAKYGERVKQYKFVDFCVCRRKQSIQRKNEVSGLSDDMKRKMFDTFVTDTEQQKELKQTALSYLDALNDRKSNPIRPWMFVGGNPGSGKTHICSAVCNELMKQNIGVLYMRWQEDSRRLKAIVNGSEYDDEIARYINVSVLYIDDMLKQKYVDVPEFTEADIKLAFSILNARYIQNKPVIISSEWELGQLLQADEGVFSRVYERSKGFIVHVKRENGNNFRLGGGS